MEYPRDASFVRRFETTLIPVLLYNSDLCTWQSWWKANQCGRWNLGS